MLESKVLSQDYKLAKELYECCYSCLSKAQFELKQGNMDEAAKWVEEFQRCKRDLDALIEKKNFQDKMEKLANELRQKGINATTIKNSLLGTVSK